jgi:hypothetical protein
VDVERADPRRVSVTCEECGAELAADNQACGSELTCDRELLIYCEGCWETGFGESSLFQGELE